jgi:uncharacterized membrane protein
MLITHVMQYLFRWETGNASQGKGVAGIVASVSSLLQQPFGAFKSQRVLNWRAIYHFKHPAVLAGYVCSTKALT